MKLLPNDQTVLHKTLIPGRFFRHLRGEYEGLKSLSFPDDKIGFLDIFFFCWQQKNFKIVSLFYKH